MSKYGNFVFLFIAAAGSVVAADSPDLTSRAQQELYEARFDSAAKIYAEAIEADPHNSAAYYGRVAALLEAHHHSREALETADQALQNAPGAALTEAAAGLADFRRGEISSSEKHFVAALKLDPRSPEALEGLARIYSTISLFKHARDFMLKAYHLAPNDPSLIVSYANTLKGVEHIAALEQALALYDPSSEEARSLSAHIASDTALGDRKLRRLTSPYAASRIKLMQLLDGPNHLRGYGLTVRVNGKENVKLLLDTGASGISLAPKTAKKAGLEILHHESTDAKGIGDDAAQTSYLYVASEIRAGDVAFADFPISVFRSAKSVDYDGLVGADVFRRFLVTIDFPHSEMLLDPRPTGDITTDGPVDYDKRAPGFYRAFRFGSHLVLPTLINQKGETLFMIDSGSSANLIDTDTARKFTGVYRDDRTIVRGVQGKVNQTSRAEQISLVFAGFRQENPNLVSISLENASDSFGVGLGGILGMPVLWQLRMTVDYVDGTVKLERGK